MPNLAPLDTQFVAVGASSAQFSAAILEGLVYSVCSSTAAWCAVGTNPTASKAAGSFFVPSGIPQTIVCPPGGAKVALIQDSAGGNASLTRCE